MYLPPDRDPLSLQDSLKSIESFFKSPEDNHQKELHIALLNLIEGIFTVSVTELQSLSGRVISILNQVTAMDESMKKSEGLFLKAVGSFDFKNTLNEDVKKIINVIMSEIIKSTKKSDFKRLQAFISMMPPIREGSKELLEKVFESLLEKGKYDAVSFIAGRMEEGLWREDFLEKEFNKAVNMSNLVEMGLLADCMAKKGRRENFLAEVCIGVLGKGKYREAAYIAGCMVQGEGRENFLAEVCIEALVKGEYEDAAYAADRMAEGEPRESSLAKVCRWALKEGKYEDAADIAKCMAKGADRESFLEEAFRRVLEEGGCEKAARITFYMSEDRVESFVGNIFKDALEKFDYKKIVGMLGVFFDIIDLSVFSELKINASLYSRIDFFNSISHMILDPSFLLSLKQTLFPFYLAPTQKGLCTPVFARDIPEPDSKTSLEDLKFTLLSGKEAVSLSTLRRDLGVQDVPLLKWFALYNEPERSRLESAAFRELTQVQQSNLRNLPHQELSRFWALNEKKMIEEGCLDLYQRIANQAPLWSQGELSTAEERKQVLYDRMSSLTRHLLHHAKEKIEDKEAVLAQLAGLSGRCEGVLTEIESMYRLYCLQDTSPASIDAALEAESFYTRQGMIDLFINEHEPLRDVHRATVFKNLVASATGMPFLLEGSFEQNPFYREAAEDLEPEFLKLFALGYGEIFIRHLEEIMKNPGDKSPYKVEVKNGEFELLSELLLKDMAHLGLFEEAFLEERKKQLILDLGEQGNWEGEMKDLFLYMAETKEEAIEILTKENLDPSEQVFLDKLLLYPLLREKLSKDKIADYLVRKGFFEQKNQQIIS